MKRRVFLGSILSVFSVLGIGLMWSSVVHAQSLAAVTTSPGAPLVAIDPGSGKVRTLVPSTGATQTAFHPSAIDATGRRLFFLGAPGAGSSVLPGIFTVDLATGVATSHYIQGSQGPISFLEYDASRHVLLSVANAPGAPLFSIDPATGVETVLVPSTGAMAAFLGTIDAAGRRLFFLGGTGMSGTVPALFTIDLDTLVVSIRQISVDRLAFLRYDAGTGRLLAASNSVGVPIVAIDPATGDVTTLVAAPGALTAGDGAVDLAGRRLYFLGGGLSQSLFTVDLSTLSISHASIARTDSYVFMQFDPFGVRSACGSDAFTLCLNQGRFSVSVAFRTTEIQNGAGASIFLTADAGAFWFFTPNNIELVVKVVDGRAFNGHFWVFGAALTDVEYTIRVTDTQTGAVKTYVNAAGQLQSFADLSAF